LLFAAGLPKRLSCLADRIACGLGLVNCVPGFVLLDFKWPKINVDFDSVFSFEILWYPPRVPADAASAVLELAGS